MEDDKKRRVEKYQEGGRSVLHRAILLVDGRVGGTRLVTAAQLASNRNSNREFLNTIIAPTGQCVMNIILQQNDTIIKSNNFF